MLEDGGRISLIARAPSDLFSLVSCRVLPRLAGADLGGFLSVSICLIFSDTKVVFKFSPVFLGLGLKARLQNCFEYLECQAKRIKASLLILSVQKF